MDSPLVKVGAPRTITFEARENDREEAEPPRSLIESAYRQLRQDIIEGRHPPGEKLRVQHLKDSYQVSAGTLREALALLVSDSLVVPQAQRGFRVAPMSLIDIEDLTRTRTVLECEAMRESIRHGDEEWEARVVGAYHKLSRAEERLAHDPAGVFDEWEVRNQAFHDALTSACQSRWIKRFQAVLYQQAHRYRRLSAVTAKVPANVHEEHRAIFEAAMARDIDAADRMLAQHIQFAVSAIKSQGVLK
ncbi:MAG TPA: FCD domain-containing protein [Reyranella sp.]|nr:FCD domain-containing protein [Reyranella sp.]